MSEVLPAAEIAERIEAELEPLSLPPVPALAEGARRPPLRGSGAYSTNLDRLAAGEIAGLHKRIVICADGTWNTPQQTSGGNPAPTNVWLLYELVRDRDASGRPQLRYYHPGVGTGGFLDRILGGGLGWGLRDNILDCYRFLIDHYRPGDYLYLFGFSRGAYTVRSLGGLIRNSGIIRRESFPAGDRRDAAIREAWRLYRGRGENTAPVAQESVDFRVEHSHPDFRITCIGVWDTVGALGVPVGGVLRWLTRHRHEFHDVKLSSSVDRAFHAVAADERRGPFVPTLWEQQPNAQTLGQRMEQVWFPGAHADVGGGYRWDQRGLANLSLRWMINRVTTHCRLELEPSPRVQDPGAQIALHDSLRWWYRLRLITRPATRVIDGGLGHCGARDSGRLTHEAVHASVGWCGAKFCSEAMPVVGVAYRPANVDDYNRRRAKADQLAARSDTQYAPDTKPI